MRIVKIFEELDSASRLEKKVDEYIENNPTYKIVQTSITSAINRHDRIKLILSIVFEVEE